MYVDFSNDGDKNNDFKHLNFFSAYLIIKSNNISTIENMFFYKNIKYSTHLI